MIPGFSCHGHGEISARRRAQEEVADNYCHLPLFFIFKCSSASLLFTFGKTYQAVGHGGGA